MTTEPSALSAAKAERVEKTWVTPELSRLATALLSPPVAGSPQATTEPSSLSAAKAEPAEKISVTSELSRLATALLSPP